MSIACTRLPLLLSQIMILMLEWVYAFPPGNRGRVDDTREYMVAACKGAYCSMHVNHADSTYVWALCRVWVC
jgi:hypothetical protein